MTRVEWDAVGERFFEAGVDRGMLYVGNNPGVPWIGLININQKTSGGKTVARYLDGVKISNRATPEEYECTIEAFMYPTEFEVCDGTKRLENGLRAGQQRRKPFNLVYRSGIGNDVEGLELGYKIHILYNLTAEPSDRGYRTLSDQNEPATFSWNVTSRAPLVAGLRPTTEYIVDTRDVPSELLAQLEDILYGTESVDPVLPSPGELIFLFDSYEDLVYDAGSIYTPVFATYDAGDIDEPVTSTIDGGAL
jgi:hypothetical protein